MIHALYSPETRPDGRNETAARILEVVTAAPTRYGFAGQLPVRASVPTRVSWHEISIPPCGTGGGRVCSGEEEDD